MTSNVLREDARAVKVGLSLNTRFDVINVGLSEHVEPGKMARQADLHGMPYYLCGRGIPPFELWGDFKADGVHAHDLATARIVGMFCRGARIPMVYDAHEYERDRNWGGVSASAHPMGQMHADSEAMVVHDMTAGIVTVSEAIAKRLQSDYGLDTAPTVVRNAPLARSADILGSSALSTRLADRMGSRLKTIVYLGLINQGRGLDTLLGADIYDRYCAVLQGHHRTPLPEVMSWARVPARVHYRPPVAYRDVPRSIRGADLAFNVIGDHCDSYRMCLPNKFFEYAFAGVYQIHSPTPDMLALSREFGLGTPCNPNCVDSLRKAVWEAEDKVVTEPDRRAFVHAHCWEAQAHNLFDLYGQIF